MKQKVLTAILGLLVLATVPVLASEPAETGEKFAVEAIYRHFSSTYTPRDLLRRVQKEATYIAGKFEKSPEKGRIALDEYNLPFSRWNRMDGLHPHTQINDFEKGWIEAHPNPKLHKLRFIENLYQKFKDHAGRLPIVEAFDTITRMPEGFFSYQYTTWDRAITGITSPMYVLNAYVDIPGTPYHICGHMPYAAGSVAEMDRTIEYLNQMAPYWSGPEQPSDFPFEMRYRYFETHFTPRDLLKIAQDRAEYIGNEFKKDVAQGEKAIDEFNLPFSRWNRLDGFRPFAQIHDTDKALIRAHPNPALHKLLNKPGLLAKFKDHSGRLVGVEAAEKVKYSPAGAWLFQYTTFIRSLTKITAPSYELDVYVRIPDTPYVVHAIMPYRAYSLEEMALTVNYLDDMTAYWTDAD